MFKSFKFYKGQSIDPSAFVRHLTAFGYRRLRQVSGEGEFSLRGEVLDIFPATFDDPLRVTWNYDVIERIDSFALSTSEAFLEHNIVILLPYRAGRTSRKRVLHEDIPIDSFVDIKAGDWVVHPQHGIGKFLGMRLVEVRGEKISHMEIQYHGPDRLFVPLEKMHLVAKFIGLSGRKPKLHKLGSGEWRRTKEKAQKAIWKVALDLLKLQAMRKTLGGVAYPKDSDWQRDFERTFPYRVTPDQDKALKATKRDMESAYAMDRLLCGDVGYGKTEVAMRAAFKAVMGGKQVAFLVPTTILAEQHYQNFSKRLENFPFRIEMLSRFKTKAQQRVILEATARGQVDILIGTHRLLSSDMVFKDLGFVIIDEEQRFGVRAKERLKEMRALVDVLTLTATPIPRTLYMSLMGARDISVIDTPPENRLSIETHVVEKDRQLIAQAITRELRRKGQVFFVHNRVDDIADVRDEVAAMSPVKARVEFAHGQMSPKELEAIMVDFMNNRIDVLVSTTIIESGIDVPNANTMIVNNADYFGLADLHQLRGRIGRFTRRAYAYFLIDRSKPILSDAQKRLEAIVEYSTLGSGFRIAMEDLQIRGAGNLLGLAQHGHISNVGFDLYCRLLRESVSLLDKRLNA